MPSFSTLFSTLFSTSTTSASLGGFSLSFFAFSRLLDFDTSAFFAFVSLYTWWCDRYVTCEW